MRVYAYACKHRHPCIHTICICIHHLSACTRTPKIHKHRCAQAHTHQHILTHTLAYSCIHSQMQIQKYAENPKHPHKHTHIHACTHVHMYIGTSLSAQMEPCPWRAWHPAECTEDWLGMGAHLACAPSGSGSAGAQPPSHSAAGRQTHCRLSSPAAQARRVRSQPGSCPRAEADRSTAEMEHQVKARKPA